MREQMSGELTQSLRAEVSDILRILIIGCSEESSSLEAVLASARQDVLLVDSLAEGLDALLIQRFNVVLLPSCHDAGEIDGFAEGVRQIDSSSDEQTRTVIACVKSERSFLLGGSGDIAKAAATKVDGFVPYSAIPEVLTQAITSLAKAVGQRSLSLTCPDLIVLDVEQLHEQVAHDDELLVELIDLYRSERNRQSAEMEQALTAGQYESLSRLAHTIKGSLGSLHAMAAKDDAHLLEMAARDQNAAECQQILPRFESKLNVLEQQLLSIRESIRRS